MAVYGWYLLKVSICIMVFYAFYFLILRKSTFFLLNRLYLILGLFLSFIIPVLNVSIFKSQSNIGWIDKVQPFMMEAEYDFFQPQNLLAHVTTINYSLILSIIYFTGISLLFFKLLFSIRKIIQISNHSETYQIGKTKVISIESNSPFSFFNRIFLPKGENNPLIIEHEMAHVRQFHWFDLLIVEIISVLLWFNPFVLLYKKSLKLQHEYLADANAIKDRDQIENYLYCMLKHIQMASFGGITSQFYCKTIKKRIVMITKNKTSNKYLGVYIFVLPLVCCMLSAFSAAKVTLPPPNSEIVMFTLNQPSIYPVDSKKIKRVPGYGERINPKTKKKGFHYGIDFAISEGEEVISTAEGVVVDAKFDSTKGNYVIIKHDEIFSTFYSHLRSISVEVGDKLERGQVIGYSGNTGLSTGPHLHYEVLKSEKRVDPTDYLPK